MSDGGSIKHSSSTSSPASDLTGTEPEATHQLESDVSHDVEQSVLFDLSDPGDMELKLEHLSEREMDELLQQAYKANKALKNELQRHEETESDSPSGAKAKNKSSGPTKGSSKGQSQRSSSGNLLPPIRNASGSRSSGPRSFTTLNNHRTSSSQLYTAPPVSPSRQKARNAVKQPATKPKPEWNDRCGV